jgi:hypothetical protein
MRILNLDDSYISHYGAYMTVRAFSVMDSFVKIKPAGGGLESRLLDVIRLLTLSAIFALSIESVFETQLQF